MREVKARTPLSMTATSAVTYESEGRGYLLELRSLNSKGLDLKCVLPEELSDLELTLRATLSAHLSRGKVELKVTRRAPLSAVSGPQEPQLNHEQVEAYLSALQSLKARYHDRLSVYGLTCAEVIQWPQVVHSASPVGPALNHEALRSATRDALAEALESLRHMRAVEGRALTPALRQHIESMRAYVGRLQGATVSLATERSEALKRRVSSLLEATTLDPQDPRLLLEIAMIADKSDVTEELTRLTAHLDHIEGLLSAPEPIGRRCDFLCQELLRETNTASSKLHEVGVTHVLVELKAEVERLREQIQNIE